MDTVLTRLKKFNTLWDDRFEDVERKTLGKTMYRDFSAGLIVALTAIPMAMGFAMASGLRPEQGIIAGALACLVGRTFGGSKYQVYGPTAAFIPVLAGVMLKYGPANGGSFEAAHGFLVAASMIAGAVLMLMGVAGLGKLGKLVPNSIIVGFTVGIAVAIAMSNIGEAFGLSVAVKGHLGQQLAIIWEHLHEVNFYTLALALGTLIMTRRLLKVSIFIPAPLLALGLCTVLGATVLSGKGVTVVADKYGSIPSNFFVFTPPQLPGLTPGVLFDIGYFVFAIVFVSAVESILCSTMADRLANNKRTPFNPDKELWGQGLVQLLVPLVNGFPCTGALARTATSIKAGAVTPFAGYFKCFLKLGLAIFLAPYLEKVPMACIGGILLWVASNMIKPAEIKKVWAEHRGHGLLMVYTAVMVPMTNFLTGVLSALVIYAIFYKKLKLPAEVVPAAPVAEAAAAPEKSAA